MVKEQVARVTYPEERGNGGGGGGGGRERGLRHGETNAWMTKFASGPFNTKVCVCVCLCVCVCVHIYQNQ